MKRLQKIIESVDHKLVDALDELAQDHGLSGVSEAFSAEIMSIYREEKDELLKQAAKHIDTATALLKRQEQGAGESTKRKEGAWGLMSEPNR